MSQPGGSNTSDQQREALQRLARDRVLSAYGHKATPTFVEQKPAEESKPEPTPQQEAQQTMPQATQEQATANTQQNMQQYHTAWTNYYQKYYQDYYERAATNYTRAQQNQTEQARIENEKLKEHLEHEHAKQHKPLTKSQEMRNEIRRRAATNVEKVKKSRHTIPIVVGLIIVLVALFMQYNRNLIAPVVAYVSPGNISAADIVAIDPTVTVNPGPEPKLIIPKLNVGVPVHFGIPNDQWSIDQAMNTGVAHFAIPGANAFPGQIGNLVISGHSAADIYSQSPYKFIFSGLERLEVKDLIYINYESKRYTYAVTRAQVVDPSDVQALIFPTDRPVLTLITCVPIGTARNRLLVFAEQISPDPFNAETPPDNERPQPTRVEMPSNPPTFFQSLWSWLTGNGWL